ncbi:hypothetical protein NMG60_11031329 [Bertholletia excelsa]
MAMSFNNLAWWLWSGKHQEPKISKDSTLKSTSDLGSWELDIVKFPLVTGGNSASSSRRMKRKWRSREERKLDREYDVVIVPSDGDCLSGSESDDSDWSIGWLEPHGPGFQSDDESEDSFAVLVPCYGRQHVDVEQNLRGTSQDPIGKVPDTYASDVKKYMEQLLSSCPEPLKLLNAYAYGTS